jgi:predicted TIM-barrel fold metal-dependent hydrolase
VEFRRRRKNWRGAALPLDIEMRPGDFPALLRLAERLPDLRLAIDHLARPAFHLGLTDEWLRGMESAAGCRTSSARSAAC